MSLVEKVMAAIGKIPTHDPGYISFVETTLSMITSQALLRKIAEVAIETINKEG